MRIIIAGCGYVGLRAGKLLVNCGHEVIGIRRSPEGLKEVEAWGLFPWRFDLVKWEGPSLSTADVILHTASSARGGPEAYREIYLKGTENLIKWAEQASVQHFLYTSSTGVYSQDDGSWVFENSPAVANSENADVLIHAEQLIQKSSLNSTIFRVGGIYGPGRGYHLKQFLAGNASLGMEPRFLNMVHVDDVAGALSHTTANRRNGLFNLVDCKPVSDYELYQWLARRLNMPVPPQNPGLKRNATNKRVSNQRLLEELQYQFRFPTFEQGFETEIQKISPLQGGVWNAN